jgi:hypothetical protein
MDEENLDESTFQLVIDQLEELMVTIIEEIRERPAVPAAVLAGVVGALVGSALAGRGRGRGAIQKQAVQRAHTVQHTAGLMQIGMRLLQNPIVRGLLFAALQKQVRGRLLL